jgi:hypothetical protein
MENLIHINVAVQAYKLSRRKFEGKDYMIVPVIMMVEGVHNGNHGSVYHSIDELGKIPEAWNGIPIMINHPEKEGTAVSANSPDILEESAVGKVFGTFVEDSKLKALAWIEELKLQEISEELYNKINDGEPIEVSVGVFTDNDEEEGTWNGETYVAVAKNHRPDHLAILPKAKGACSLEDGCGLGINKEKDMETLKMMKELNKVGFSINQLGNNSEAGYKEKMDAIYNSLRGLDKEGSYNYLEEFYDSDIVYSKSTMDGTKMYKQAYKFESGKIDLVGEPVEVRRKVEYVVNSISINKKTEKKMAKNDCPKCAEKVNVLILNTESGFAEGDREMLSTLSETQLDKLVPKVIEKTVEKTIEVHKLAPEDQAALEFGKKQLKERREGWISGIQANAKDVFTEVKLNAMDDETLEGVYKATKKEEQADFTLNGGHGKIVNNASVIEPLPPTGIEFETKK